MFGIKYMAPFITKGGLSISVQASDFHYCSPNKNSGPWSEVEMCLHRAGNDFWRILVKVPELRQYAEDEHIRKGTLYAYVPVDIVAKMFERLGGLIPEDQERFSTFKVNGVVYLDAPHRN